MIYTYTKLVLLSFNENNTSGDLLVVVVAVLLVQLHGRAGAEEMCVAVNVVDSANRRPNFD